MSEKRKKSWSTPRQVVPAKEQLFIAPAPKNSLMASHSVEVPRRRFLLSVGRKMTFIHPTLMARRMNIPPLLLPCWQTFRAKHDGEGNRVISLASVFGEISVIFLSQCFQWFMNSRQDDLVGMIAQDGEWFFGDRCPTLIKRQAIEKENNYDLH